jgi:hypothetical protein
MKLKQVDDVGLQPFQGFVKLFCCRLGCVAVNFGHQEDAISVSIAQGFSHSDFAGTTVVVPAIIHKINAIIDGSSYYPYAGIFIILGANVEAT